MRAFVGQRWRGDFHDYHRLNHEYRLSVRACAAISVVDDLYFVPPRRLRVVWNYISEVGLRNTLRKIASRSRERFRNEKYVSIGIAEVLESPDGSAMKPGTLVAFLAPCHPPCVERLVLPEEFIAPWDQSTIPPILQDAVLFVQAPSVAGVLEGDDGVLSDIKGWSAYSGVSASQSLCNELMRRVVGAIRTVDWRAGQRLIADNGVSSTKATPTPGLHSKKSTNNLKKKKAILFGYGQYAKTVCIPNVMPYLDIARVHEIDPLQIPQQTAPEWSWSTSPWPLDDLAVDAYLIAGFHHTHAPLAMHALERGIHAVVEKPVTVDREQLTALVEAMRSSSASLFSCYHKRYLPFNDFVRQDLQLGARDPVSYHCIVYEVPLPSRHWYRWPNSKSRLISNGCHWIDHFLFLNGYDPVVRRDLAVAKDGTINCTVQLSNGACFTMVLTDNGSSRIGVQDYIELRANGHTARMVNGSRYSCEDRERCVRRKRIHKHLPYQVMYRTIAQKILLGEPGDSIESVEVPARLVDDLQSLYEVSSNGRRERRAA